MTIDEIIKEAINKSPEEIAEIIDLLHRAIQLPDPEIEKQWVEIANKRMEDIRSGAEKGFSAKEVNDGIWNIIKS